MGSEALLYGYTAVCVSMLIFNLLYYFSLNRRDRRMGRVSKRLQTQVDRQLARLRWGGAVERRHLLYLERKLSRVANLTAFERMMTQRREADGEAASELLEYERQIQPVILHLAVVYRRKEDIQAAYFAWFLARHQTNRHMELDGVQDILVDYMNQDSLYCRVNAFQALCRMGSPRRVADAVTVLDRNGKFFHSKLLTDSLLSFTGGKRALAALLLERFDSFSTQTRLSILNYIRFHSGDYRGWVLPLMNDPEEDKELRLSAIRYFGRYVYPPAKPALLAFAADRDPLRWEYAAVSVSALAIYDGTDVTEALTGAVCSSNWYVRSNAAVSLTARGLDGGLSAAAEGGDQYAREMMRYQLQLRQARKEGAAV